MANVHTNDVPNASESVALGDCLRVLAFNLNCPSIHRAISSPALAHTCTWYVPVYAGLTNPTYLAATNDKAATPEVADVQLKFTSETDELTGWPKKR